MKLITKDSRDAVVIGLENDDGVVYVTADTPDGDTWYILTLNEDGTITRDEGLDESTGFQLDSAGRIKERK